MLYLHDNDCNKEEVEFLNNYPPGLDDLEITAYEYLFSYFYEILLHEGPQKKDYLQMLWNEQREIFENINIHYTGDINDLLLLSSKYTSIGNKICIDLHENILRKLEENRIENLIKIMKQNKSYYFYEKGIDFKKYNNTFSLSNLPSLETIRSISRNFKKKSTLRNATFLKISVDPDGLLLICINPEINAEELSTNNLELSLYSFNFRYVSSMTLEEAEKLSFLIVEHISIINNKIETTDENSYLSFNKKKILKCILTSNKNLQNLVKSLILVEENLKKQIAELLSKIDELNVLIKNFQEEIQCKMNCSKNDFLKKFEDYEYFLKSCLSLELSILEKNCITLRNLCDLNDNDDDLSDTNSKFSQAYCNQFIKDWAFLLDKKLKTVDSMKTKVMWFSKIMLNDLEYKNHLAKDIMYIISSTLLNDKLMKNCVKEFVFELGKGIHIKKDNSLEHLEKHICNSPHIFSKRAFSMKSEHYLRETFQILHPFIPNYNKFEILILPKEIYKLNTLKPHEINKFAAEIIQNCHKDMIKSKKKISKCNMITPITFLISSTINEKIKDIITIRALVLKNDYRFEVHSISVECIMFEKLFPKEKINKSTYVIEELLDLEIEDIRKNEIEINPSNFHEIKKKWKRLEPSSYVLTEKKIDLEKPELNIKNNYNFHAINFYKQIQNKIFEKFQDRTKEEIFSCLKAIQKKNNLIWFSVDDVVQIFEAEMLMRDKHFHVFKYQQNKINCYSIKENCAICRESLTKYRIYQLSCQHWFHLMCITKWFDQTKKCPICRTDTTITIEEFPPLK